MLRCDNKNTPTPLQAINNDRSLKQWNTNLFERLDLNVLKIAQNGALTQMHAIYLFFFLSWRNTLNSFDHLVSCLFYLIGLKKFIEVDLSTCDSIALYLNKDVPYGLGGYRQAAAVFDMTKDMIGALWTDKSVGKEVIEFLKATKADITVYTVCKQLKDDKMRLLIL